MVALLIVNYAAYDCQASLSIMCSRNSCRFNKFVIGMIWLQRDFLILTCTSMRGMDLENGGLITNFVYQLKID